MATAVAPAGPVASSGPPLRASRDIAVQRWLPLGHLLLVELIAVTGTVVWAWTDWPWWLCAAMVLAVSLTLVGRRGGMSLPGMVAERLRFASRRSRGAQRLEIAAAFDHVDPDGQRYGFRWDGAALLAVVEIDGVPEDITVLDAGLAVSGDSVPLGLLSDCLRQFDVELDSILVLSHGARSHGQTAVAAVYDAVLGPLPAIAHRTVRVVVRFDPSRCPTAVTLRGGGRLGIVRTAMVATRRVANRLAEAGLRVEVLSAADIGRATAQLCDGVDLEKVHEEWTHCADGNFRLSSFALDAGGLTTDGLARLWTMPSYSTTLALRMCNIGADEVGVSGTVRFDTFHTVAADMLPGLTPLPGRQFRALVSTLPLARPEDDVSPGHVADNGAALTGIRIPAAGCGQVVGADPHGRAVALPLFGPHIERVHIAGSLQLVQQIVLRALAIGARILVHSNRSGLWRELVANADDSGSLWVTDFNRGTLQAGWDRNFSVAVFDGVPESATRFGVTTVVVGPAESTGSGPVDVRLTQNADQPDSVEVTTRTTSTTVTMVATDEELRFIGRAASGG